MVILIKNEIGFSFEENRNATFNNMNTKIQQK
jgi:hypothetical protein